ncbi:MAG: hypothetical protein Q4F67_08125 [Propionibacteriaceae bacterium]|nr:hypothetical protein [Propionibacteriaceae bacterium]
MPSVKHPLRDGLVALAIGCVLGLVLLAGFRVVQQWNSAGPTAQPGTSTETGASADACLIRDGGEGNGAQESDPVPGPDFPRSEHVLDTGRPVEVRGNGNAEIAYHRLGEFATVVDFACENCTGMLSVFNTGAALPIVSGETTGEPVDVEWLIDTVHEITQGPDNSLLVRAEGDWRLTLKSWHDLPVQNGRLEGTGSRVVRVESPGVRLEFAPLNSRDTLNVYAYRLDDRGFTANACLGRFESRELDLNGGQVLLVWARGEWSLEPA